MAADEREEKIATRGAARKLEEEKNVAGAAAGGGRRARSTRATDAYDPRAQFISAQLAL